MGEPSVSFERDAGIVPLLVHHEEVTPIDLYNSLFLQPNPVT